MAYMLILLLLFKVCSPAEKAVIDSIIDSGPQNASELDHKVVHGEYSSVLREIKYDFPFINICKVQREVSVVDWFAPSFQHFSWEFVNVNEWQNHV